MVLCAAVSATRAVGRLFGNTSGITASSVSLIFCFLLIRFVNIEQYLYKDGGYDADYRRADYFFPISKIRKFFDVAFTED